jgi:hypothetical protein
VASDRDRYPRFEQNLAADLEGLLEACLWERVEPDLWEKGRSRLRVDEIGVFLYRLYAKQGWVRTAGQAHMGMRGLPDRLIYFPDGFILNLLTGD